MSSEKTLNELRKATLASYIAKAGRSIRTNASIGKDFEHHANQYLKKAWDAEGPLHSIGHPAKDPEAAKDARAGYKASADLEKTFKDKARKRIQGVAVAANKLAKEDVEQIDELKLNTAVRALRSMKSTADDYYASQEDQRRVTRFRNAIKRKWGEKGAEVADKVSSDSHTRQKAYDSGDMLKKKAVGADDVITRGKRKGKLRPEVQGAVKATTNLNLMKLKKQPKPNLPEEVEQIDELKRSTVASYLSKAINRHTTNMTQAGALHGAASVVAPGETLSKDELEDHLGKKAVRQMDTRPKGMNRALKQLAKEEVESVNEVSRSTIAKVAQARYNQAQKALKDKNYHEYVQKMKKAIKASDATTPKTGWSHEEETQLPEAEPIVEVSAQEKYRQIREAKVKRNYKTGVGMRGYSDPPKGAVTYPNDPRNPSPKKVGE